MPCSFPYYWYKGAPGSEKLRKEVVEKWAETQTTVPITKLRLVNSAMGCQRDGIEGHTFQA